MSDHLDSIHRAKCQCDRTGPETSDLHEVWRLAIAEGWYVDSRVCLCPDCWAFVREWQARVDELKFESALRTVIMALAESVSFPPPDRMVPALEGSGDGVAEMRAEARELGITPLEVTPEVVDEIRAESRETAKAVSKVRRSTERTSLTWPDIAAFVTSVQPMEEE